MTTDVARRVAVVTGRASGIGRGTAKALVDAAAAVVIADKTSSVRATGDEVDAILRAVQN